MEVLIPRKSSLDCQSRKLSLLDSFLFLWSDYLPLGFFFVNYTLLKYVLLKIFLKLLIVGKKAKVAFDYEAQDADELTLHMGDVVDFMEEVEEGWWKGKLHGKVGVFPSNFVEMIEEEDTNPNQDKPAQIKSNSRLFDILHVHVYSGQPVVVLYQNIT